MKIGNTSENTLITSVESTNKFKIQATGKAFSILSNALYQHKVKAVVREIGCNAFDAHIDAGTVSTPFTVSLPSKEDPHFKVRDFGIGLAEDKFVEIYTTYFGSSKADSNDHTGGLGLGSKTPFIMSKTFTVHSYYNGMEYMWHSYVNDNGEPDVVMLTKKETTEPNGLLVIVPIGQGLSDTEQNALFREFQAEAQEIYQWFDTIPTVTTNGKPVEIKSKLAATGKYSSLKLNSVDETRIYFETEHSRSTQSKKIMVKMGNVIYPYDLSTVRNLDRFGGAIGTAENVINYLTHSGRLNSASFPIVVEVGMGDVDIAPSRESLSLSNTTELTIINSLVRFVEVFFNQLQHTIDNAKSTYEKYQALYAVPPMTGRKFTIEGKEIDPRAQSPIWAFSNSTLLQNRTNFLRSFNVDDYVMKYRRAGTRGIIPLNSSFDMGMYGPNAKERNVILVDAPYKGELRLWINANTQHDSAVVVVFGRDTNGAQRPLTAKEMEPFLEDNHPQVQLFSKFKNKPTITPTAARAASLRVTDEDVLIMGTPHSNNFFTQGNATLKQLSNIPVYDAKKGIDTVYICYERANNNIYAELRVDPKKAPEKTLITNWSRATGTFTGWNANCEQIYNLFVPIVRDLNNKQRGLAGRFEHDGKVHDVMIKHAVFNKDGYAQVIGNPDRPNMLTLHEAIEKLIVPYIPSNCESYMIDDRSCDYRNKIFSKLSGLINFEPFKKWNTELEKKTINNTSTTMKAIMSNTWLTNGGYRVGITKNVVRTYDMSFDAFKNAIVAAKNAGIAGADVLHSAFFDSRVDLYRLVGQMDSYYTEHIAASWYRLLAKLLTNAGLTNQDETIANFLVDFYEKQHKIS